MENLSKMDDLEVPFFLETPILKCYEQRLCQPWNELFPDKKMLPFQGWVPHRTLDVDGQPPTEK